MKSRKKSPEKLKYEIAVLWDGDTGGRSYIQNFHPLELDMPSEYGGKNRFPCPDEIFFSSIGGCLLTTFLSFKDRLGFNQRELRIAVKGAIDSVGPKGYRVTKIEATIYVEVEKKDRDKAEKCAELAKEYCHLTRSLENGIPVEVQSDIAAFDK